MSQIIKVQNNQDEFAQRSFLSTGATAGATTLPVVNTNGAVANWGAQIGNTGEEKTEIKMVASIGTAGTTVALASLTYPHPENTPVYWVKYDQIIFKKSATGTAGTATPITNGTVSITPDSEYTQLDDTSAVATDAYLTTYYNSANLTESGESDWITPSGYSRYSLIRLRQRAEKKYKSKVDPTDTNDWINEWRDEMDNSARATNKDYGLKSATVTFGADTALGTITAEDFIAPRSVWLSIGGSNYVKAIYKQFGQVQPSDNISTLMDTPRYYFVGDSVIGREPQKQPGTAIVYYYPLGESLDNDTDELPLRFRAYSKSFVDYCRSQEAHSDNRTEEGALFEASANQQKAIFQAQAQARDKSDVHLITMDDTEYTY